MGKLALSSSKSSNRRSICRFKRWQNVIKTIRSAIRWTTSKLIFLISIFEFLVISLRFDSYEKLNFLQVIIQDNFINKNGVYFDSFCNLKIMYKWITSLWYMNKRPIFWISVVKNYFNGLSVEWCMCSQIDSVFFYAKVNVRYWF